MRILDSGIRLRFGSIACANLPSRVPTASLHDNTVQPQVVL